MAGMEGKRFEADAKQFGAAMGQIAHGQAMMAAVRDYVVSLPTTLTQQAPQPLGP